MRRRRSRRPRPSGWADAVRSLAALIRRARRASCEDGSAASIDERKPHAITVSRSAPDRQLARTRTNRVIGVMIGGLTRIGIDRASIQTSVIALGSRTVGRGTHRRRVYTAEIDLTVTVRRIALLSPLFAVASHAGGDGYAGPNLGFTDPSAGMIGASRAALADARRRADAAAGQLGMHVAGVQSVDLDPGSGTQLTSGGSGSATTPASSKPTTPVVPGRQQVDANVQVVYQLASGTI